MPEPHDPRNTLTTRSPEPRRSVNSEKVDDAQRFAVDAARLLADRHCEDVVVFDVRGVSPVTQYLVIASGTSDRQIKSLGAEVGELAAEEGFDRYGSDRDAASRWVVVDLVEVMVHLFEPATRGHYDLEMMWGDAPKVPWRRG